MRQEHTSRFCGYLFSATVENMGLSRQPMIYLYSAGDRGGIRGPKNGFDSRWARIDDTCVQMMGILRRMMLEGCGDGCKMIVHSMQALSPATLALCVRRSATSYARHRRLELTTTKVQNSSSSAVTKILPVSINTPVLF